MQSAFKQHLLTEFPELFESKSLIAISGGIDSVVLAHLAVESGLAIDFAHCNYGLRGKESDGDQDFVINLAKMMEVKCHVQKFDMSHYVKENQSIQLAARKLRYDWFEELRKEHSYDFVLTAHHLNDSMETFMINLLRGTGLDGLTGIPKKNGAIIRPLLPFGLEQIHRYADKNKISWREDHTNADDGYLRNRIRHHLIPWMEQENESFPANFLQTLTHLNESAELLEEYRRLLKGKIVHRKNKELFFDIEKINSEPNPKAVLYQLLKEYNFSAWDDIYDLLGAQTGKLITSATHRLLKDRTHLVLQEKLVKKQEEILFKKNQKKINFPEGSLICEKVTKVTNPTDQKAYLAIEKLDFPLKIRRWKAGDKFQPLGMKGRKKISDFLKDKKASLFEKERTWVLISGNQIAWVIGYQIDHRFRIKENTTDILKVEWLR